jgi:diguanylate cyclase (GGDEF)-like protein
MSHKPVTGRLFGRMRLGVRAKIVFVLLATLLVALTVNSLLSLRTQERDILAETDRRGREVVHFVSQHVANDVVSYDYHSIEITLQDLVHSGDIVYARVDNARGNVMAAAGQAPADAAASKPYAEDIQLNGETLGRLEIHLSTERLAATLKARQRDTLVRQLLAILAVMIVELIALSLVIIRPLTVVSRVIGSNLNTGGGLQRIPLDSDDELGDLAREFNALQDRLEEARRRLESRVDLANRELQTANKQLAAQTEALRAMNRELEQLSVTDSLTGLYNRRYFEKLMESEVEVSIRNDETISILLLDIDRLREFNETFGHGAGDEIIREVAQSIAAQIRPTDVACRYGGDEFFILCRRATIANALGFADDLLHRIADTPLHIQDQTVRVSISIGVATIPGVHRVHNAEEFFRCADEALHHCKQHGNGITHYSRMERNGRSGTA